MAGIAITPAFVFQQADSYQTRYGSLSGALRSNVHTVEVIGSRPVSPTSSAGLTG